MYSNTTGFNNVAVGNAAMYANTTGESNVGIGYSAGSYNNANTNCTFVGYDADQAMTTDFDNSTALGNGSRITASNQVVIGNTVVTEIGGYDPWVDLSDGRYKTNVQEDVAGLTFIKKLRPVTYHMDVYALNQQLGIADSNINKNAVAEKEKIVYSGFIAQEVEASANEIGYNFHGVKAPADENDIYGLRYGQFVVPLVKSVQELSDMNEQLKMENEALKKLMDEMNKRIEVLENK